MISNTNSNPKEDPVLDSSTIDKPANAHSVLTVLSLARQFGISGVRKNLNDICLSFIIQNKKTEHSRFDNLNLHQLMSLYEVFLSVRSDLYFLASQFNDSERDYCNRLLLSEDFFESIDVDEEIFFLSRLIEDRKTLIAEGGSIFYGF